MDELTNMKEKKKRRMSKKDWVLILSLIHIFSSSVKMASMAGVIGAIANTLRLELIDLIGIPPAAAAFTCASLAGILASLLKPSYGYPRISITVPSIVIMVPGMYLYLSLIHI